MAPMSALAWGAGRDWLPNGIVLEEEVGEGSFACVYRGRCDGRPCAIKIAKVEIEGAVERLAAEAAVLGQVRHAGWVRLEQALEPRALVLEWLEGESLHATRQRRARFALREALDLILPMSEALIAAHRIGCVHGDVQAKNVLLVAGRGPVLIDPGPPVDAGNGLPSATAADVRDLAGLLQELLGSTAGEELGPGFPNELRKAWREARAGGSLEELLLSLRELRRRL